MAGPRRPMRKPKTLKQRSTLKSSIELNGIEIKLGENEKGQDIK